VISVERLRRSPAEVLGALVTDSESHGLCFVRRLVDEWTSGVNRFEQPGEALFVARRLGAVVGVCGLNIDPYVPRDNDQRVGRVRHLYVLSTHRRLGIGRRLVSEALTTARGSFDRLHLRTGSPAAAAFYERLGFRRSGDDPHHTHIITVDERLETP
jgi:ribosomal protein S18 acetylase RimI-like enzyme